LDSVENPGLRFLMSTGGDSDRCGIAAGVHESKPQVMLAGEPSLRVHAKNQNVPRKQRCNAITAIAHMLYPLQTCARTRALMKILTCQVRELVVSTLHACFKELVVQVALSSFCRANFRSWRKDLTPQAKRCTWTDFATVGWNVWRIFFWLESCVTGCESCNCSFYAHVS
jgi:hypothetical protein